MRAEFHDYSGGEYFVTICTRDKIHYFGKIIDGVMIVSTVGKFAHYAMETLHTHYSYVEVPLFVVMPNHIHAIICIRENTGNPAATNKDDLPDAHAPVTQKSDAPGCIPTIRTALGVVVGGFKQAVTRFARRNSIEFGWQKRYHDHIIRGATDGNRIAEYIETNVARWSNDCFYGE